MEGPAEASAAPEGALAGAVGAIGEGVPAGGTGSLQALFGLCRCGAGSDAVASTSAGAGADVGAADGPVGADGTASGARVDVVVLEIKNPCPFYPARKGSGYTLGDPRPHGRVAPHVVPQLQLGELRVGCVRQW